MKQPCPQEYLPESIITSIAKQIFEDLFQYKSGILGACEYTADLRKRFEFILGTIPFSYHQAALLVWHYRDSSPTNSLGYSAYALKTSLQETIEVLRSAQRLIVEYASEFEADVIYEWIDSHPEEAAQKLCAMNEYRMDTPPQSNTLSEPPLRKPPNAAMLARTVDTLRVNANSISSLRNLKMYYLLDLVMQTKGALLHTPHLGESAVREIEQELSRYNLYLGMQIDIVIVTEARKIIKNRCFNVS